jgi:hypothetical protein
MPIHKVETNLEKFRIAYLGEPVSIKRTAKEIYESYKLDACRTLYVSSSLEVETRLPYTPRPLPLNTNIKMYRYNQADGNASWLKENFTQENIDGNRRENNHISLRYQDNNEMWCGISMHVIDKNHFYIAIAKNITEYGDESQKSVTYFFNRPEGTILGNLKALLNLKLKEKEGLKEEDDVFYTLEKNNLKNTFDNELKDSLNNNDVFNFFKQFFVQKNEVEVNNFLTSTFSKNLRFNGLILFEDLELAKTLSMTEVQLIKNINTAFAAKEGLKNVKITMSENFKNEILLLLPNLFENESVKDVFDLIKSNAKTLGVEKEIAIVEINDFCNKISGFEKQSITLKNYEQEIPILILKLMKKLPSEQHKKLLDFIQDEVNNNHLLGNDYSMKTFSSKFEEIFTKSLLEKLQKLGITRLNEVTTLDQLKFDEFIAIGPLLVFDLPHPEIQEILEIIRKSASYLENRTGPRPELFINNVTYNNNVLANALSGIHDQRMKLKNLGIKTKKTGVFIQYDDPITSQNFTTRIPSLIHSLLNISFDPVPNQRSKEASIEIRRGLERIIAAADFIPLDGKQYTFNNQSYSSMSEMLLAVIEAEAQILMNHDHPNSAIRLIELNGLKAGLVRDGVIKKGGYSYKILDKREKISEKPQMKTLLSEIRNINSNPVFSDVEAYFDKLKNARKYEGKNILSRVFLRYDAEYVEQQKLVSKTQAILISKLGLGLKQNQNAWVEIRDNLDAFMQGINEYVSSVSRKEITDRKFDLSEIDSPLKFQSKLLEISQYLKERYGAQGEKIKYDSTLKSLIGLLQTDCLAATVLMESADCAPSPIEKAAYLIRAEMGNLRALTSREMKEIIKPLQIEGEKRYDTSLITSEVKDQLNTAIPFENKQFIRSALQIHFPELLDKAMKLSGLKQSSPDTKPTVNFDGTDLIWKVSDLVPQEGNNPEVARDELTIKLNVKTLERVVETKKCQQNIVSSARELGAEAGEILGENREISLDQGSSADSVKTENQPLLEQNSQEKREISEAEPAPQDDAEENNDGKRSNNMPSI